MHVFTFVLILQCICFDTLFINVFCFELIHLFFYLVLFSLRMNLLFISLKPTSSVFSVNIS